MVTIGGGQLLDIAPLKARRSAAVAGRLRVLEHGSPEEVLEEQLRRVGPRGGRAGDLAARTPFGAERLRALLARLVEEGRALAVDRESYLHAEVAAGLRRRALETLGTFHAQFPLKPGMSKEELRMRLGEMEERVFLHLLGGLEAEGAVAGEKDKVRLASHQVRLDPRQKALLERLEAAFRTAGVSPPSPEEAFAKAGSGRPEDHELLQVLLDERRLIRIKEGLLFHVESLQAAEARLVAHLRARKEITPGEFKDLLGITRKYAIPLMEYFDAQRLTVRVGDKRVLRADPAART